MRHPLAPIPCKPWALNGLSERLMVSHYENDYGTAVRHLNAVREALATADLAVTPPYQIRAMKREELATMGSVVLHELYFGTLGGDGATAFTGSGPGTKMLEEMSRALEEFGGIAAWRREFVALAHALAQGGGWVVLSYSRRERQLYNYIAVDHTDAPIDAVPLLVLDMFEHAYHIDFGANASAYIDAFMRNIDWAAVSHRLSAARDDEALAPASIGSIDTLPSVSVEELTAKLATSEAIQVIDARPRHYFSRTTDMMQGATWRDPDRVDEWSKELSADTPVVVYCAYGYSVGCGVTAMLRERGFDAKYVQGGLSAWYAAGGERALRKAEAR